MPDVAKRSRGPDLSRFTKPSKWQKVNAKTVTTASAVALAKAEPINFIVRVSVSLDFINGSRLNTLKESERKNLHFLKN